MKVHLSRRYRFSASHRLHGPRLTEEENRRIYGKCANPYGHGHDYVLEVTFSGPVCPETGMVANVAELDAFVEREVVQAFDHKYLNEQIAEFRDQVPTTENVCREVYRRLHMFSAARLERVAIEETGKNSFEYTEERNGAQAHG
jgi:6-pyruvoyltetrahydropterin/6-carboxytetrahydropterin synthase